MVRLFRILGPVFCIACTASMAKGNARRDDGYDGTSVPEPNTYRYSIVNGEEYKQALKKPSHPALRYMLDITKERITYNKSIVKSRADRHRLQVKDTLRLPKTNLRTHTTATVRSWLELRTRHLRSFRGNTSGNALRSPSPTEALIKGNNTGIHGTSSRTTESWQFGYKGHGAVITGPRPPDRLRRRESLRYSLPDEDDSPASGANHRKLRLRHVHRAALCLFVACFVLMAITVCLVIAALWLRSRYRSKGRALYSTLGESDPDHPAPGTSPSPQFLSDDDLSPSTGGGKDELPRKLAGQSLSEPVIRKYNTADDSPHIRKKLVPSVPTGSPIPINYQPEMQSARPSDADVSKMTLSPVVSEFASVTHCADTKRKYVRLPPSKPVLAQRSFYVSRTDLDQKLAAYSRHCLDDAATRDPSPNKLEDMKHAAAKENCEVPIPNEPNHIRKHSKSEPMTSGLREVAAIKGGTCRVEFEQPACGPSGRFESTSSLEQGSSITENAPCYSDSDNFRIRLGTSPVLLPTFIRRSLTKTTSRWRAAGPDATTPSTTDSSSLGPQAQRRECAIPLAPLAQSTSTDSFESLALTKHTKQPTEADCCYQVTNTDPWLPLLALCKRSKAVDFLNVIHEDCQATKLSWDEPGGGDVFRVLGSQGDQLVRVLRLREREVPWHTSRLRVARELSNLKNSVDNRTSAFFVDARASLVRDTYPRLLSSAHVHQDDQFLLSSAATSPEERGPVAEYLVTEIQPGWRPLPNYKLNNPNQALSVLGQACWALAVAEAELEFEHRLPGVGAVLVRPTQSPRVEFTLRGHIVRIPSAGIKVRLQGLQLARIRIGTRVEFTDVTRFPEFARAEDEVAVCVRIADMLNKRPTKFEPLTNVLWLQHLADWLSLQYAEDSSVLSHWQGVLAASCSAERATVGSRHTSTPSGTPPT